MALFSRLLKLNTGSIPLEDFFTELVAYLFGTNKEILYAWLKHSSLLDSSTYLAAHVSTQQAFDPLDWHLSGSRPDILIEIGDDNSRDIIFIESKIGSQEGINQLKNYADILHGLPNFRNKLLVYITRDFEPKNPAIIFQKIPESNVQFRQLRWHEFYRFLKLQANTMLVQEIITFMQEYDMAHNNQFSSVDVITLANFTKSLKLMDQIIWGGVVSQRFKEVLGAITRPLLTEVQRDERYSIRAWKPEELYCGLGFDLQTSSLTDYPKVFLRLDVPPNVRIEQRLLKP